MPKLTEMLSLKNETETSCDLYLYGDIVSNWIQKIFTFDDESKYPAEIRNFLKEANGRNLNIYINSAGGNVFAGTAIYNMLKRYKGHKVVHVDSLAGSIASMIMFAGDEIHVPNNAYIMVHKPSITPSGAMNAHELREYADTLDKFEEGIISVYLENKLDGIPDTKIREMVNKTTWIRGSEAADYFRVQSNPPVQVLNCASDLIGKDAPEDIVKALNRENEIRIAKAKLDLLKCQIGGI